MIRQYWVLAAVLVPLFILGACDDDDDDNDAAGDAGASADADADGDADGDGELSFGLDALDYADEQPALAACVVENCQGVDGASFYELEQCALQKCRSEYEAARTLGDGKCKRILFCVERCILSGNMGNPCQRKCMEGSTYEYVLEFLEAGICVEDQCHPDTLADPLNHLPCFLNTCKAVIDPCCGGTVEMCM